MTEISQKTQRINAVFVSQLGLTIFIMNPSSTLSEVGIYSIRIENKINYLTNQASFYYSSENIFTLAFKHF